MGPGLHQTQAAPGGPHNLAPRLCGAGGCGSTSVDVTRKGVDKAYRMAKLATAAGIPAAEMIFIGDALYPGGNDYAVHEAGIDTVRVRDAAETCRLTEAITLCLA